MVIPYHYYANNKDQCWVSMISKISKFKKKLAEEPSFVSNAILRIWCTNMWLWARYSIHGSNGVSACCRWIQWQVFQGRLLQLQQNSRLTLGISHHHQHSMHAGIYYGLQSKACNNHCMHHRLEYLLLWHNNSSVQARQNSYLTNTASRNSEIRHHMILSSKFTGNIGKNKPSTQLLHKTISSAQ